MGLNQITLKDYDTVVAVTQQAINEGLAEYLNKLDKKVALYFKVRSDGTLFPVNSAAEATYIFTGTLDYTRDIHGNPVDIVTLYTDQGNQTVSYNVTFKEASFISKAPPIHVSQEAGKPPWIFKFRVALAFQETTFDKLPSNIREKVEKAVKNLGPNMFSIQQLLVDLNEAVFDTYENIKGLTEISAALLETVLKDYLVNLQKSGSILFGYGVQATEKAVNPTTFTPTDLNFCVTPYIDKNGNRSNPALDTLNYLVMTDHRRPPDYPPKSFGFNWVEDPSKQGALAVKENLFVPFVIEQLNPLLKTICKKVYVKADWNSGAANQTIRLDPGDDHQFTLLKAPDHGQVATYSYHSSEHDKSSHVGSAWYQASVEADYGVDVSITLTDENRFRLNGSLYSKATATSSISNAGSTTIVMPKTTFSWSVDLELQTDLSNNGSLRLVVTNGHFDKAPKTKKKHESWWDKFLGGLSGQFLHYANNLGDLRDNIKAQIESNIENRLEKLTSNLNAFVFPGANTFAFMNPQFGATDDLVANITYLSPNPKATAMMPVHREMPAVAMMAGDPGAAGTGTMVIQTETEMMKNLKAAQVLPPQSQFSAVQTASGEALFFSIGDKSVLYLSVEKPGHRTGWMAVDLSNELSVLQGGGLVQADLFSLSQDSHSGEINLAVVASMEGQGEQMLFVLDSLSDAADASWQTSQNARHWTARPFDGNAARTEPLDIAFLHLSKDDHGPYPLLIVGKREKKGFIQKYTVNTDPSVTRGTWKKIETAENYDVQLGMGIGKTAQSTTAGLYELYTLGTGTSLLFTPFKGIFGPPAVTKMTAPPGASALALIDDLTSRNTDLYVTGEEGLYLFQAEDQANFSKGLKIIDNPIFKGTHNLHAHGNDKQVILWGLNGASEVFYIKCPRDRITEITAWSYPLPIQSNVEQIAGLLNRKTGTNQIYAHTDGLHLEILNQDPVTTNWMRASILLPSLNTDDFVAYNTYTTHISVTDENNLPKPNAQIGITANAPGFVYINDRFTRLSNSGAPVTLNADESGTITIVQETQSLSGLAYTLHLSGGMTQIINPTNILLGKMSKIKSGGDLRKVQITDENGVRGPLVPPSIPNDKVDSAAQGLVKMVELAKNLPANGSLQQQIGQPGAFALDQGSQEIWGIVYGEKETCFYEGEAAMAGLGLSIHDGVWRHDETAGSLGNAIATAAGDLYRWLQKVWHKVEQFFVKTVNGIANFFIQLGENLYHFVLDCIAVVGNALEFVLKRIEVLLEDLIKWVGFLFRWKDILRTHNVLKNIYKQYIYHAAGQISDLSTQVAGAFDSIKQNIDDWAGLEHTGGSIVGTASAAHGLPGQHSPQSNWGVHHAKSNVGQSTIVGDISPVDTATLMNLLHEVLAALEREGDIFTGAYETIKNQILGQITHLSAGEIVKRVLAVIADIVVESVENIIVTFLDILAILINGLPGILDATIRIPVISPLYKTITGNELSLLDLCCLVVAIPTTLIYKLLTGNTPFPDDSLTDHLIHAESFEEIQALYQRSRMPLAAYGNRSLAEILIAVMHISAAFGVSIFVTLVAAKAKDPKSKTLSVAHGIFFFAATGPNVAASVLASRRQTWDKVFGEVVYTITVVQKLVDVFTYKQETNRAIKLWAVGTKFLDSALGVLGFVPPIVSLVKNQDARTIVNFLGNTSWNTNRIITPIADLKKHPRIFAGKLVLMGLYGTIQFIIPNIFDDPASEESFYRYRYPDPMVAIPPMTRPRLIG